MKLKVTFTTTHTLGALSEIIDVPDAEITTIKEHLNKLIRKELDQRDYNHVKVKDVVLIEDIN